MKLSDAITQLQALHAEHGDLELVYDVRSEMGYDSMWCTPEIKLTNSSASTHEWLGEGSQPVNFVAIQ